MLTLDASPVETTSDIRLYSAVWATQGRGYDVRVERGYIAIGANENYHAATAEDAIAGLLRKQKAFKRTKSILNALSLSIDAFIAKYQGLNIEVSVNDARNSGSCEYGIRSWCEAVGIDINRGQVPLSEVLEAFKRRPLTEVRRAVLYAVRRRKKVANKPDYRQPRTYK